MNFSDNNIGDLPIDANRSALMQRVRRKDTAPELTVRRLAHELGYRFRLQKRELPGTPDLVFPRLRKIVFVHGCFWHRHGGCKAASTPKTRAAFWLAKFDANVARDAQTQLELQVLGWDVLVIWECETRNLSSLRAKLLEFLTTFTSNHVLDADADVPTQ